jgi:23S rRNA pseudouridine2605 synthase
MTEIMRLQKYLSRAGVASRRSAETLILQGRVRVNGARVSELGTRVDPDTDQVEVDGAPVGVETTRWVLLNKPRGTLTTRRDPGGRPTVYTLLPEEARTLPYVGRLDRDTEGLLLFTNEGDLLHRLAHPSYGIARRYLARVVGEPTPSVLKQLEAGVELEDGLARAEAVRVVRVLEGLGSLIELVIREGKKREIRRLFEAVGHPVRRLRRVAFGPIELGDVPVGSWRPLSSVEIRSLRNAVRGGPRSGGGA